NTVDWERTEAIAQALDRVLADSDRELRLAMLRRMQREKILVHLATLGRWLADEHQPECVAAILVSLHGQPATAICGYLEAIIQDMKHSQTNRRSALALFVGGLDRRAPAPLLALAQELEDGAVLADALGRLGQYPKLPATAVLTRKLRSPE